mmetsp:Transcript_145941/g.466383  ORF Transcript_145941/g.466383 Transcript_145941/m.466383 type:complete len:250 (-) Transcript_145941:89-838(-)
MHRLGCWPRCRSARGASSSRGTVGEDPGCTRSLSCRRRRSQHPPPRGRTPRARWPRRCSLPPAPAFPASSQTISAGYQPATSREIHVAGQPPWTAKSPAPLRELHPRSFPPPSTKISLHEGRASTSAAIRLHCRTRSGPLRSSPQHRRQSACASRPAQRWGAWHQKSPRPWAWVARPAGCTSRLQTPAAPRHGDDFACDRTGGGRLHPKAPRKPTSRVESPPRCHPCRGAWPRPLDDMPCADPQRTLPG